ncbi:helix-turn-helix transcriptional regulator [Streptomyces sp. NPDC047043]|uniref:helix-turn-helix transcriptional regulator n=1 Tax=Streptomyces sp. NPDC047043 TaxID=3154497 RepID=UPI0033CD2152
MTGSARTATSMPSAANSRWASLPGGTGVAAGTFTFEGDGTTSWHRHNQHQLEYAAEGIVGVETATARHRLPSRQAVWIPAGLAHQSSFDRARTVSVFFDPLLLRDTGGRVRVLPVDPILRAMLIYATRWPIGRTTGDAVADSYFEALSHLVRERLDEELPFRLPTSTDPLITAVMRHTDTHLATVSLDQVCRAVAVSERTLRRRFRASTGMSWRQYLLHSRLLHAMALLVEGDSTVLGTAIAVGFDSASAFSRAFQAYTGETPSGFRQERSARPPLLSDRSPGAT